MKKLAVFLTVIFFSVASTNAFAQNRGGMGDCCFGNRAMYGFGDAVIIITEAEAKANVQRYVSENFKGWTVGNFTAHQTPRGNVVHRVEATDASGNRFFFGVHPCGIVRGPIPVR